MSDIQLVGKILVLSIIMVLAHPDTEATVSKFHGTE